MRAALTAPVTLLALSTTALLPACTTQSQSKEPGAHAPSPSNVKHLTIDIVRTLPHDPTALTQGLEMAHGTLSFFSGAAPE
ncbi:glutaminyl-peptide cyclotransferase [Streptomyces sp. 142MFCol3.1]|uniref:glutaminyl-peptide cyclotransferase n=1 Tax=Streptomyces sp. 142MFCol3.1 TaxID=1172179 RepID=UPI000D1B33D4